MKNIKNIPEWAKDKKYLVIRKWGDGWEFFDAWDENEKFDADTQAWEVNGEVVTQ